MTTDLIIILLLSFTVILLYVIADTVSKIGALLDERLPEIGVGNDKIDP